jgi:hypothetical protein
MIAPLPGAIDRRQETNRLSYKGPQKNDCLSHKGSVTDRLKAYTEHHMVRLSALLLLAALTAFGADVAGKWKTTFEGQNGPREITFTIQVTEGKLSGTATSQQGEAPITEGKVDGDKVTFTVEREQFKAVFTGTVSGDKMKLSGTVGERTFEMVCDRQ